MVAQEAAASVRRHGPECEARDGANTNQYSLFAFHEIKQQNIKISGKGPIASRMTYLCMNGERVSIFYVT